MTQQAPFTAAHRKALEQALLDTFIAMDREIARPDHSPWIDIYKVRELLFRFWSNRNQKVDTGYIFTLNQDLWLERNLSNQLAYTAGSLSLPGLERRSDQQIFITNIGHFCDQLVMKANENSATGSRLAGQFNVIKLHGWFNWQSADGSSAMVVGAQKKSQVESSLLLAWHFEIFRRVLSAGDVRLMIVGYGFGDEHVNAAIADAVLHHGLKVFIWNTDSNLRNCVLGAPHGADIWAGLLSTAKQQMIDVFPENQAETQEYIRIRTTFFG